MEQSSLWQEIADKWPEIVYLKDIGELSDFPYSKQYFRNLVTGQTKEHKLKESVFYIGKYPAIRKSVLCQWLAARTGRRA